MWMLFKEITKENFEDCMELEVGDEQVDFVTYNAVSIAQSYYEKRLLIWKYAMCAIIDLEF